MKISHYWAKARYTGKDEEGHTHLFDACGWSFGSLREAQNEASTRAKRLFELIMAGGRPGQYEYHGRPIKEERLKDIREGNTSIAVVTRNRYGALVLNCANVLFVDVDFPRPRQIGPLGALMLAISRKRREARQQEAVQAAQATIELVVQWAKRNPGRCFRLYRTKEGLRLLFTDGLYDPTAEETATILSELEADPLYVDLTRKQECFRARLTSKPWRCGSPRPPNSFPWIDSNAEAEFRQWEAAYTKRDAEFKVCELIREFGSPADIGSLQTIVDVHDRGARVTAHAELA